MKTVRELVIRAIEGHGFGQTMRDEADALDAELSRLRAETTWRPTHRHVKGGLYQMVCAAEMEVDLSPVMVYRSKEGRAWGSPGRGVQ
jgi:hypothetical protein